MQRIIHEGNFRVGGVDQFITEYARIEVDGDIVVAGTDNFITHICKCPRGPVLHIKGNLEITGVENTVYGVFRKGLIFNTGLGNIIRTATV
jgi:hypothetical protein